MDNYEYKGCLIYPSTRRNTETGRWKPRVTIEFNKTFNVYEVDEEFTTPAEAIFNCLKIGKKIIDEDLCQLITTV